MPLFRKMPVEIEAIQLTRETLGAAARFVPAEQLASVGEDWKDGPYLDIRTLEGVMHASDGDWIVRGVKGEFYPCKPDIFAVTYESVDPDPDRDLPDGLLQYIAEQDAAHATAAAKVLEEVLTQRERELVQEAAMMGWVLGMRHADVPYPGKERVVAAVVDACLAFSELYPAITAPALAERAD
jgi:hypothetical protein